MGTSLNQNIFPSKNSFICCLCAISRLPDTLLKQHLFSVGDAAPELAQAAVGIHQQKAISTHQDKSGNQDRALTKPCSHPGLSSVSEGIGENSHVRCDQVDSLLSLLAE